MISGIRNLLWIVPFVLLLTSPVWKGQVARFLAPHGAEKPDTPSVLRDRSFGLTDVRLSRFDGGRMEMALAADRVESEENGMDVLYMEEVDLLLYDQGRERAHVVGGEGLYDTVHSVITLVEDVAVTTSDDLELRTDALRYLVPYKTMKTASAIFFKSRRATVRGTGMMYNLVSGDYRVGGRVIGDMK